MKVALRAHRPSGIATEEIVVTGPNGARNSEVARMLEADAGVRKINVTLLEDTKLTEAGRQTLDESRSRLRDALRTLPWEGLALSRGEPALTVRFVTVD
jgi:nicotinate phosphoribosyltransferase